MNMTHNYFKHMIIVSQIHCYIAYNTEKLFVVVRSLIVNSHIVLVKVNITVYNCFIKHKILNNKEVDRIFGTAGKYLLEFL